MADAVKIWGSNTKQSVITMKFTLSWLKRHLDTKASLDEICEKLTAIGLEVEGVEDPGATFAPFSVALIEKAEPHPDADKLKLCHVKTVNGEFQVVCGAPNARAGMKGIFAPEGSYIPGLDVTLKKAKIRGVESCGMMVSEKEMCLSDEHKGIIEVDDNLELGTPMAEVFGLNDPVIEIALTPDRADCAGVYGIARDLAAAGLGALKPLEAAPVQGGDKGPVGVSIEDNEGCPLFLGRYIAGVKNGPSPEWLQRMLKAVGLRPISALVDITNLMTHGYARPMHVYDADKLQGDIVVKAANAGDSLEALDDKSYEAAQSAVAITDNSGLIGFGGIIGGVSTGCEADTVNVFVEAAYFKPERIARAGRDMGVSSDARYRFERGVDPEFTAAGMEIATTLILEICGGQASEVITAGSAPEWKRSYDYAPDYVRKLIGVDVAADKQKEILQKLGFEIAEKGNVWSVTPPSWRGDVFGKADIAEEVIRIIGYEHIPSISVRSENCVPASAETLTLSRVRQARTALAARSLHECVTWSFMDDKIAERFGGNDNADSLALKNPISSELSCMRPSILPNLVQAAGRNADLGNGNVALFEVGPAFKSSKPNGQDIVAAGIRYGQVGDRHWADKNAARGVDVFDAKADALAALEAAGAPAANARISRDAPDYYHPGRSGALRLGKNVLAYFGELHPGVLDEMGVKANACGFEVFLENIPEARRKNGTEKPLLVLPSLQPLSRDFAFLVDENVPAEDILRAAFSADKTFISDASIFDVYQGKGVPDNKKSVAMSVDIQPQDVSLTDEDIEEISKKIITEVQQKTGASLRT